jgi:CHASE2 domain-containing sensor protein
MVKRSLSLNSLLAGLIALAVGLAYYSSLPEQVERASRRGDEAGLPETPMDQRILLAEIEQKSQKAGSWPWPRI